MSQNATGTSIMTQRSAAHLQFEAFKTFLSKASSETTIAAEGSGMAIESKKTRDFVGHILRSASSQGVNNSVRERFRETIMTMFGVKDENDLPDEVKSVMKLDDYHEKGKPLTARRIRAVTDTVSRIFDAEITKLADAARSQGVPADLDTAKQFQTAIMAGIDDRDLLDFVTANIKGLLTDENAIPFGSPPAFQLCAPNAFTAKINTLTAIFNALRTVANGDPAILTAGKRWLAEIIGNNRPLPPPTLFQTLSTALDREIPLTIRHADQLTDPAISAENLNKRIREIFQAVNRTASACSRALGTYDSDDEGNPCRAFLISLTLNKCAGASAHATLKQVLDSPVANDLKAFYRDIADDLRADAKQTVFRNFNGIRNSNARLYMADFVDEDAHRLDTFKAVIDTLNGLPDTARTPISPTASDMKRREAYGDLCRDIQQTYASAGEACLQKDRSAFLSGAVTGNGVGADLMRYAFARKIGHAPYRPEEMVRNHSQDIITRKTCQNVTATYHSLSSSPEMQRQAFKQFREKISVFLPDARGHQVELSKTYETACDQLALFLTQGKKRYAELNAAEKNQVTLALALIAQGNDETFFEGPARALNPLYNPAAPLEEGKLRPAFETPGKPQSNERTINLSLDNGSLTVDFSGKRGIRELGVLRNDFETFVETPVDGTLSVDYTFTVHADAFARMGTERPGALQVGKADVTCSGFKMGVTVNEATPKQIAETEKRWPKVSVASLEISVEETLRLANKLAGIEGEPIPKEEDPPPVEKPKVSAPDEKRKPEKPGFLKRVTTFFGGRKDTSEPEPHQTGKKAHGKKIGFGKRS
ncbi:MAG: hypothetical protein J6334_04785 [Kiritimatiellae bacterium]|nr:hypothetical protein [Kiritimatiellia bacterium]